MASVPNTTFFRLIDMESKLNRPLRDTFISLALLAAFHVCNHAMTGIGHAQTFNEDFSIWPVDIKINGTVIVCAGPEIQPSITQTFVTAGKDDKGSFIAIWFDDGFDSKPFQDLLDRDNPMKQFGDQQRLPTDPKSAQRQSLEESLRTATGVLLISSKPLSSNSNTMLTELGDLLHMTIERGGVVCGIGPVVEHFGKFRLVPQKDTDVVSKVLNLLPDCIAARDMEYPEEKTIIDVAVEKETECRRSVGIEIPTNTAAILRNRKFRTFGSDKVTFSIAANDRQPRRVQRLGEVKSRRANPYNSVVDLTAWRRDAIDRQLPPFPPSNPPVPDVENGTLFIVGGGGMPKGLMRQFVDLAGGDQARLIFVPCTDRDKVSSRQRMIRQWKTMGVAAADVLHTKDRNKANTDDDFLLPLSKATGIWFGGGRQWNFVDSYYGTKAHKLMKNVLKRGGVIGGSSAGASIQGDYLARANPVANFDIMAAGYERGLGFLTGVAIDQHFSQRGRQKDMTQLANRYPQLLGIGIDEGTGIKVQRSIAEVVGRGKVFFYDRRQPVVEGEDDFIAVEAKSKFNLAERKVVEP